MSLKPPTDAQLAARIVAAIKACDAADATAIRTTKEKAIIAGKLLDEAHQRHQGDEAFTIFLELAGGVGLRRAQDLIAISRNPEIHEQHQIENREAGARHRAKVKAEKDQAKADALANASEPVAKPKVNLPDPTDPEREPVEDDEPVVQHGDDASPSTAWLAQTAQLAIETETDEPDIEPEIEIVNTEPILMSAELQRALLRVRDANARVAANPSVHNPRSEADKLANRACGNASADWRYAVDELCAILNPELQEPDEPIYVIEDGERDVLKAWSPPMVAS
jgi:hypothetical protein